MASEVHAHLSLYDLVLYILAVGQTNYRRAEGRRQSRSVEKTKDVERDDL
jgi:hypothetical protein